MSEAELYVEYPTTLTQYIKAIPDSADTRLQPVYLRLSMARSPARLRIVSGAVIASIASRAPRPATIAMAEYPEYVLGWEVPALTLSAMRVLMDHLTPYMQRIVDGYSVQWSNGCHGDNGGNVVLYNSDARDAGKAIEGILDRYDPEPGELIHANHEEAA